MNVITSFKIWAQIDKFRDFKGMIAMIGLFNMIASMNLWWRPPKMKINQWRMRMTSKSSYMVRKRDLLGKTNESIYISLNL